MALGDSEKLQQVTIILKIPKPTQSVPSPVPTPSRTACHGTVQVPRCEPLNLRWCPGALPETSSSFHWCRLLLNPDLFPWLCTSALKFDFKSPDEIMASESQHLPDQGVGTSDLPHSASANLTDPNLTMAALEYSVAQTCSQHGAQNLCLWHLEESSHCRHVCCCGSRSRRGRGQCKSQKKFES